MREHKKKINSRRIIFAIQKHLNVYNNTIILRNKLKCYMGFMFLIKSEEFVIKKRAYDIIRYLLMEIGEKETIKDKTIKFITKMRKIQEVWRSTLQLNKIRIKRIKKNWDEAKKKLITQNSKGRRHLTLLKKLKGITNEVSNKVIENYYFEEKKKFFLSLNSWTKAVILFNCNRSKDLGEHQHINLINLRKLKEFKIP